MRNGSKLRPTTCPENCDLIPKDERERERKRDRWTQTKRDRQTDRDRERQTGRHTQKQTDSQIESASECGTSQVILPPQL